MSKFFIDKVNFKGNNILINDKEDINHIIKVLRLGANNTIIVCDGAGNDYKSVIRGISKNEIVTEIEECIASSNEPSICVTLFQGIPKSDKMEYIIQKAVELGVNRIVPVVTKRTIVKIDSNTGGNNKVSRWQRIAYEAAKQCGRGVIPSVSEPLSFRQAIKELSRMDIRFMPYENETRNNLRETLEGIDGDSTAGIIIGPEGGFSDDEAQLAVEEGVSTVTLGTRILRTETAGITALSILMYETGNI